MHLEFHTREAEGIAVLALKGRLVLGAEDVALRQCLQSLLDSGQKNVVLDLADISTIDTAGFGSLVFCSQKFRDAGGRLVVLHQPRATDLFKLDTALEAYADELSAINSFFPDRAVPHYDILEFLEEEEQKKAAGSNEPSEQQTK